jgi:hypothetical protein
MDTTKKKRQGGKDKPTIDEFHQILKQLTPNQKFTAASVDVLRTAYFSYLREVASSLVEYDKVTDNDDLVATACSLENSSEFRRWTEEGMVLLKSSHERASTSHPKQKRAKKQVTAEMEAEQERLLEKSKEAMVQRHGNK